MSGTKVTKHKSCYNKVYSNSVVRLLFHHGIGVICYFWSYFTILYKTESFGFYGQYELVFEDLFAGVQWYIKP